MEVRPRLPKWLARLLQAGFLGLALGGMLICFFPFLFLSIGPTHQAELEHVEFPLTAVEDLAVSSDGLIYVGLAHFGRVQVYDGDGAFLRGAFVNAGGGSFRFATNDNGEMQVVTARGNRMHTFDQTGRLVESVDDISKDLWKKKWHPPRVTVKDTRGNRYAVRGLFKSRIVGTDPTGVVLVEVTQRSALLQWLAYPYVGSLLAMAGIVGLFGVSLLQGQVTWVNQMRAFFRPKPRTQK